MKKVISASFGEIALKGLNRGYFENTLVKQIKSATREFGSPAIYKDQGKIYIEANEEYFELIENRLRRIFGIVYISPCIRVGKDFDEIGKASVEAFKELMNEKDIKTFKVETRRVDKNYPMKSPEVSSKIGGVLLRSFPDIKVDVHNPEAYLHIDIKQYCYVYTEKIKAYGGLPVGTNGKGLLLLSGGIDSPVAGFMMAKRGVKLSVVHYHSYPYTSERAKGKVVELAKILTQYCGSIKLYIVPFTDIQLEINQKCNSVLSTVIMRRSMMRIAEKVARKTGCMALVTGESLGQVASQTIQAIYCTDNVVDMPVFRPLIGMDKIEVTDIARRIETYETSIQPYEDCCTVFTPKHPKTKPTLAEVEMDEKNVDFECLENIALENVEIIALTE